VSPDKNASRGGKDDARDIWIGLDSKGKRKV